MFNVSAQGTMKSAAKCDKHCEMQTSVNQLDLERKVCLQVLVCKLACATVSQRMQKYYGKCCSVAARYDCRWPHLVPIPILQEAGTLLTILLGRQSCWQNAPRLRSCFSTLERGVGSGNPLNLSI